MKVLKRKEFARWQRRECLSDAALCHAVSEIDEGLVDADLGGALYKKRIARPGGGKRAGYRTLLAAHVGNRYVFLHGFAKNEAENVSAVETRALRIFSKAVLGLPEVGMLVAVEAGELLEVRCGEQDC